MIDYCIAYLDDSKDDHFLMERHCRAFNRASKTHRVDYRGFEDVEEFLMVYKDNPNLFDSVILDIDLQQDSNGWDVFKEMMTTES